MITTNTSPLKKWSTYLLILCLITSCSKDFEVIENRVQFDGVTFTVLSPSLISVIANQEPSFDFNSDYRDFTITQNGNIINIITSSQLLSYTKGSNSILEGITIKFNKNNSTIIGNAHQEDRRNLGGVIQRADRMNGRLEHKDYNIASPTTPKQIPNGLLSERGWTVLKSVEGRLIHNDSDGNSDEYYVFCYGDNYKSALQDFTNLNGKIPLLPKWSLGNWFSRYQPYKDVDYKEFVTRFRKENIPIDVIVPDMNWHKDGWFGIRYDEDNFPDMEGFFNWTHENGIHVGFNHHPGSLIPDDPRSRLFAEEIGMDLDSLVKSTDSIYRATGWEDVKGSAFYGECNWKHVKPYFKTFLSPIMDIGLDFHWVDGTPSLENLREYYKATENHNNKRAIVLTRQGYGSFDHHKYPIGFSADTYISWESLKYNLEITVSGANNGVYWSHDIGGHMAKNNDESDRSELFARWVQFGAMTPFNRLHATGGVTLDNNILHNRKPWEWGETVLNSAQKIMQLKYKLMPYLYSLNRNAYDNGLIMTRGMYFDYPKNINAFKYSNSQYMIGSSVLVAPITSASEDGEGIHGKAFKNLWIPDGTWYDYFSGESIEGPKETMVSKTINEMPLFVKEGAIIPTRDYVEYTNQKPLDHLTIVFYQASKNMNTSFNLYEDDGETLEYKNNAFRWTKIDYDYSEVKGTRLTINPSIGLYNNEVKERAYTLILKYFKSTAEIIKINDKALDTSQWKIESNHIQISIPKTSVEEKLIILIQ